MGATSPRRNRARRSARDLLCIAMAVGVLAAAGTACSTDSASSPSTAASPTAYASPSSSIASATRSSTAVTPVGCGADRLKTMTLRQKLGQQIVVGVTGTADARSLVAREPVGGIFIGSWTDKSILTDAANLTGVQADSKIPLMVTVDQEGGRVSRLSSLGIDSPSARELARTKTPAQVRAIAANIGRQLKAKGITVDFAPDADVSNESDDEVIGDRSFSDDPDTVATYAQAFAAGLESAGVLPVYKHFPGHGHGSGDSHLGIVRTPPLAQMIRSDLVPYKSLLKSTAAAVMVGHLIVPGLTAGETPASLSRNAIGMLRTGKPYGGPAFDGVVFSDDLSGMGAISQRYSISEAVRRFLVAGGDIALWISTDAVTSVLNSLEAAVKAGTLSEAKVNASVVRILRAKGQLSC